MCKSICIRIVASAATMRKFRIVIMDAKCAFRQTGLAQCDGYVKQSYTSKHRNVLWILETPAYLLINSNAKLQHHSDALFIEPGLEQVELNPQIFALYSKIGKSYY